MADKWARRDPDTDMVIGGGYVPPHNIEAEQSVLGVCTVHDEAIDVAAEILEPSDFYRDTDQTLFEYLLLLRAEGVPVTYVSLSDRLRSDGKLDMIGIPHILSLLDSIPYSDGDWVRHHCRIVKEKSLRRQLVSLGVSAASTARDEDGDLAGQVDTLQDQLLAIQQGTSRRKDRRGFRELSQSYWDSIDEVERCGGKLGIYTGYDELDRMTGGLRTGLYVVAGPTGGGKTIFASDIARHVALHEQKTVAIYSLEMVGEQLLGRMLAAESRVPVGVVERGRYSDASDDDELKRITSARDRLNSDRLQVWDTSLVTVPRITADARGLQVRPPSGDPLGLVIVDYLQLVTPSKETPNRTNDVSAIAQGLKNLASILRCPVIALSQLNREKDKRKGGRPNLSDLRESGTIAHAADMVVFLHCPDFELAQMQEGGIRFDDDRVFDAEIIVAKHRHGPTGSFHLAFNRRLSKYGPIPYGLMGGRE